MHKKFPSLLLALIFCLLPMARVSGQGLAGMEAAAANGIKFDAPLEFLLAQITSQGAMPEAEARRAFGPLQKRFHLDLTAEEPQIHLLLQIRDNDDSEIRKAGIPILGRMGDVAAVALSPRRIEELRTLKSVVKVEAAKVLEREIDISMMATRANLLRTALHDGTFGGHTGVGALIGIVDSGIDIFHADFRNPDGSTRIKAIWDVADRSFLTTGGVVGTVPPMSTPSGQPLGTVYTEVQINAALRGAGVVNARSLEGHGHHVAGIAAGNGRATGGGQAAGQYIGMAPQADLIIVQVFTNDEASQSVAFDDRVLAALAFIEQKAAQLGRPVAVNMSFGTHVGAHDGTSLMERAIDNFCGPGKRGRAVVKSAGNDGNADIHAGGQFGPPGALNNIIDVEITKTGSDNVSLNFWFSGQDTFNITFEGGGLPTISVAGLIRTDPANGDKELYVETSRTGTFRVRIEGLSVTRGRFDAWIPSRNAVFNNYQERLRRITIPGTSRNVITVGAYNTRNSWIDVDNASHVNPSIEIGRLAGFSSDGPTRDGRQKPDLTAPGQRIGSSLAAMFAAGSSLSLSIFNHQDILQDGVHVLSQGTSFAAPHVTGLAALMLARNPDLDALQIRDLMVANTLRDAYTGSSAETSEQPELLPDSRWGYGKLDAKATFDATPDPVPTRFLAYMDYPSPNAVLPQTFNAYGWALASHGVASVEVLVDGIANLQAIYGHFRPDVCQIFPTFGPDCPGVGFSVQVPGLAYGDHTLTLRIVDRFGNRSENVIAPRTIQVNPLPIRAVIDFPSAGSLLSPNFDVYGWAISDAGIRQVEVLLDGAFVTNAILNQVRPDVCAVYPGSDPDCPRVGYRAILTGLGPGTHQLTVRITDRNFAVRSLEQFIQINPPRIQLAVETPGGGATLGSSFQIGGWVISPAGIAAVEIYVDGILHALASLGVSRPDVCAAFPGADPNCPAVGFIGVVSDIPLGRHTLTLLVRDRGGEISLQSLDLAVAIQSHVDVPQAGTPVTSPFEIAGWAISPSGISQVIVLLDGSFAAMADLLQSRPDVCAVFPLSDPNCPNVGFRAVISAAPGNHSLQLLITSAGGQQTLLPLPPIGVAVSGSLMESQPDEVFAGMPKGIIPGYPAWQAAMPGRGAASIGSN